MCSILLHHSFFHFYTQILIQRRGGRGWVRVKTPKDRLTMCRWIGSHFHDCIDFYGVAFSDNFNRVSRMELHIF